MEPRLHTAPTGSGTLHTIDWLILIGYLLASLLLGLWLARRNRDQADYFVAGRRLSGWLAGASMAATTFSVDTPLYVAGLVGALFGALTASGMTVRLERVTQAIDAWSQGDFSEFIEDTAGRWLPRSSNFTCQLSNAD